MLFKQKVAGNSPDQATFPSQGTDRSGCTGTHSQQTVKLQQNEGTPQDKFLAELSTLQ